MTTQQVITTLERRPSFRGGARQAELARELDRAREHAHAALAKANSWARKLDEWGRNPPAGHVKASRQAAAACRRAYRHLADAEMRLAGSEVPY